MATVSAHVARALAESVTDVFGVMGNGNAYVLDALLRDTDVRFTAVRHEAGAVLAADAYYRTGGRLAAATGTYGAGFTNMATGIAEAVQAQVPVVIVVGDEPTTGPRPWDIDQEGCARSLGARTVVVDADAPARSTREAVAHALRERTVVVLAIPYDLASRDAGEFAPREDEVPDERGTTPDPAAVSALADALRGAERPVILSGRGAVLADAGASVGALADRLGALTVSSALARSLAPDACHDLGVAGGFGAPGAMDLVQQADVLLVVGARLNQFTMRFGELAGEDAAVWQIDVAPEPTNARVDGFVRGDARAVLEAVLAELGTASAPGVQGERPWRESVDAAAARAYEVPAEFASDGLLDPRAAAARLAELLPAERVVVSDGGHFIGWANMYWPVAEPRRMAMVGTAFQAIGIGWPCVAGAALARPDDTVVLTTGDGGGLMAIADMESAIRVAGGRGMAVVWNDAAYSAEVHLYGGKGLARDPMLIEQVDFAAVATALGAEGVVVRSLADLERLASWTAQPAGSRPFLVLDLRVSPQVIAPYQHEVIRVNSGK